VKQTKVQKSARGEECTLRIASGVCNYDVETTVLAHISFQYGSDKRNRPNERNAVYACSACHDAIGSWNDAYGWEIGRALVRTTERRDELGV
jgi:cytochrome c553